MRWNEFLLGCRLRSCGDKKEPEAVKRMSNGTVETMLNHKVYGGNNGSCSGTASVGGSVDWSQTPVGSCPDILGDHSAMFTSSQFHHQEVSWHRSDSVDFVDDDLTVTYDLETTVWHKEYQTSLWGCQYQHWSLSAKTLPKRNEIRRIVKPKVQKQNLIFDYSRILTLADNKIIYVL